MMFSACLEWLFAAEANDFADRIRLARAAGIEAFEFWKWTNKDVGAIERAMAETGMKLTGFVAEPMIPLTDPASQPAFLAGLADSIILARRLGAGVLIAQAGDDLAGRSRAEQRTALVACLTAAADLLAGTGIRLGLEPLNTLIDHKGYFLPSTVEALDIVDEVGRPEIAIVYDIYHSAVMGERTEEVLAGRVDRVAHVHVADHPGRGAPGSGGIDLAYRLAWLFARGYRGPVGLEFRPGPSTAAILPEALRSLGAS
jgi:hydroxypyruvate isomerase